MKKAMSYLGWILFAVTLIALFWVARPENTVDFRGFVKSIEYNEQEKCTYFTASMILDDDSTVIIKAKDKISVKDVAGNKMKVSDVQIGDMIDLDYKGKIDGKDSVITAKWINVVHLSDQERVEKNQQAQ